jgi:tRNA modification GTPase
MITVKSSSIDTIYALSTAASKAAIGVIRVSGPGTEAILLRVCGHKTFENRRATVARIFDERGSSLDRALVIRFSSPRSFTGEDMIEFHVTGGRAVVSGILRALKSCPGTRPAEAGEFARRAFDNGKIDLAEVEGLASVVEAETNAELRHALTMASGELSRQCERVRDTLLNATVRLESMLDFSDVEDASDIGIENVLPSIRQASVELEGMLLGAGVSERLRDGMTVVIAGPPNVGKSTLLNYLARRDVAIVAPMPGTTRDILEVAAEVGGFPVTFVDTAGLRETLDPVEAEGVTRAKKRGARADLVLWLSDSGDDALPAEAAYWTALVVQTKIDLADHDRDRRRLAISAKTGEGIKDLVDRIAEFANNHFGNVGRVSVGTDRQLYAAEEALSALRLILREPNRQTEVVAEDLRLAVRALGRISGRIEVEEVLGEIFARLCVGK